MNVFLKFCKSTAASLSVQMESRDLIYLSINPQYNWTYRKKIVPEDSWSNIKLPPNVCWICDFSPCKFHCVRIPVHGECVLSVQGTNLHKLSFAFFCCYLYIPSEQLSRDLLSQTIDYTVLEKNMEVLVSMSREPFVCSFQLQPRSCSCIA